MAIVLGPNQYGKAETRVVRICRDGERHEIRDLNVSTCLRGDFSDAHLTGDQAHVLPTDSQRNTCFAFAKSNGAGPAEDYAVALARHFADDIEPVRTAHVDVTEYRWERIRSAQGDPHPHAFARMGPDARTASVTADGTGSSQRCWVIAGVTDMVVLKSTGSEFRGFLQDRYTTLAETDDRILATSLTARWRYATTVVPWDEAFAQVRQLLLEEFAELHSLALQQSLYRMGAAVLAARDDIAEIRLSAPNKHHFLADLAPFGLENPGEVFYAADRPYGLIQCAVTREGAAEAGPAWDSPGTFC